MFAQEPEPHRSARAIRIVVGVVALASTLAPVALAQQQSGTASLEDGRQLYVKNCALCHRDSGSGDPPRFPALGGDDGLGDPARLVRSIHRGRRDMPAFPGLTPDETTALASYVLNTWAATPVDVTAEQVAATLQSLGEPAPLTSVWDGVFTEAQAMRGRAVYSAACAFCHGDRLDGAPEDPDMRSSPAMARARFLREWEGLALGTLLAYSRATMPEENPNSLTPQEYVDVIAYQLQVSGMPPGDRELPIDPYSLARIIIHQRP